MIEVLLRAASLIAIVLIGYLFKRRNIITMADFPALSSVVIKITLPCAIISSFSKLQVSTSLLFLIFLGFLCNVLMVGIGYLISWNKSTEDKAFYMINCAGYNIGSFAVPYIQGFMGPQGFLAVCLFDAGNAVMCTGATYSLASGVLRSKEKMGIRFFLSNFFSSVPVDIYLLMTILSLLHIRLPSVILSIADLGGAANPFLAMLLLGVAFEVRLSKDQIAQLLRILTIRYTIATLLAAAFYFFLPFTPEIKQAMAIAVFSPLSSLCTIFTARIKGDANLSGTINSMSIVISTCLMTGLLLWMHR